MSIEKIIAKMRENSDMYESIGYEALAKARLGRRTRKAGEGRRAGRHGRV